MTNGTRLAVVRFDETSWTSKASFIRELNGIGNLSFIGSDVDVQRIRYLVYQEGRDVEEVTQVASAGIHFHKIGRREVLVYVEPGYSYNQLQVAGTHRMGNIIEVPPRLKDVDLPEHGDKALTQALTHLLKVNSAETVSQILGWVSACHLKAHYMRRYHQFPVLSLWGSAGAGKNKTAELFTWLNGVEYGGAYEPLTLPGGTTVHSVVTYCSTTTTIPRILDEYNKSKLGRMYDLFGEVMKAAWGGSGPGKGTPRTRRGGAPEMVQDRIRSPIIVLSEQAPTMPALQHRSVLVSMSKHNRAGCEDDFESVDAMRGELLKLAKVLMGMALRTDITWVEERMARYRQAVPKMMEDRPRYSYQVLLTGLDFMGKALREIGIPLTDQIADLKQTLLDMLVEKGEQMAQSKAWTEVDSVFETLGVMITLADDATNPTGSITRWKHFATDDKQQLYLDMPIVHALYCQYMSRNRQSIVMENLRVFLQLLEQEHYYVGSVVKKELTTARPVVQIDLRKMADKGHPVTQFEGA
jgi:hypothetical protein